MKRRYIAVSLILAAFLLAGCAGPGSDQGEDQSGEEEGVVISDIVVSRTDIKWGETTRINVLFQNTNTEKVRGLKATLIDNNPLEIVGKSTCNLGRMFEANTPSGGPRKQCVWTLKCGDNCREISKQRNKKFDLKPYIKYTYQTRASGDGDAVSVEFQDPEDFDSSSVTSKTYSIGSGDIELSVDYESPKSANSGTLDWDYELRNIGEGNLIGPVDFIYSGSFVKNRVISSQSLKDCRRMGVPDGETSQSSECPIDLQRPKTGTIYTLRMKGTYRYSKEQDIDMSILPSEGEGPLPDSGSIVRRKGGLSRDRLPGKREDCFSFCYGRQEDSIGLSACLDLCSGNR